MSERASGTFTVKMTPQPSVHPDDVKLGRYLIDKQFEGELTAISRGEMLGAGSPASGSAGYVALEQVTGSLKGRNGTFALQHSGTMMGGQSTMSVTVVPGSASGELAGLLGAMTITADAGKHSYEFEYELLAPPA